VRWLAAALLAVGCFVVTREPAVHTQRFPAAEEFQVRRVVVSPFRAGGELARLEERPDAPTADEAAKLVGRYVAEALGTQGLEVIPADDLSRSFPAEITPTTPLDPVALARVAADRFGADAVMVGAVDRYRDRTGEALGTTRPASVSFRVTLHRAPDGARLWNAVFDETQAPLNENVLNARRYPGGGTRWLSAEELARWGAEELAKELMASK
jgi:hypothetical protein